MTILLLPIFLFGLVISWIVYLGVQQANESALATQRIPEINRSQQPAVTETQPRAIAHQR